MADIEERAEAWADTRPETHALEVDGYTREDLIAAYLAGSAQTQDEEDLRLHQLMKDKDYTHG